MAEKLLLSDVKDGKLVGEIRQKTVEFIHNGKEYDVDILIKQLPFCETDELLTRLNRGEKVANEWIAKALVDDKGKNNFTPKQVGDTFVQPMAQAIFDEVFGTDSVKKTLEKAKSKKDS